MARTVKCPGCGADLTVKDDNRDFMFCEYCGTKVRLDDYQETHRYVNEAEVRKVEAEKEIQLKKMEMEEREKREYEEKTKKYVIYSIIAVAVILLLLMLLNFIEK